MPNDSFDDGDDLDDFEANRQTMVRAASVIMLVLFAACMLGGIIAVLAQ